MNYNKNGKECFLCLTRKKFIQITPEERIRQNFIKELINKYEVPENMIDVEVPLTYFTQGQRGRADIIVYEQDKTTTTLKPLILIECKEPNVLLTDIVFEQVRKYDDVLMSKLIIITNGNTIIPIKWDDAKNEYIEIESIPKYSDLIADKNIIAKNDNNTDEIWERPNHLSKNPSVFNELKEQGFIGVDTDKSLHSFFTNMAGIFLDDENKINELNFTNKKLILDGGLRYTTFGNSAGGGFPGLYRYIILEEENKENQIVSFSLMGKLSAKNHPKFGNSTGHTLLLIAIDDFEKSHLSLELTLDRFLTIENDKYTIFHDGTLTNGKKGRVKNIEVINFVKNIRPDLVKENKIYLGTLDNSAEFKWERQDFKNFISNIIDYALIRDAYRKTK